MGHFSRKRTEVDLGGIPCFETLAKHQVVHDVQSRQVENFHGVERDPLLGAQELREIFELGVDLCLHDASIPVAKVFQHADAVAAKFLVAVLVRLGAQPLN